MDSAPLRERACTLGFGLFGIAEASSLDRELADFRAWLAEGRHGEMQWLERDPERRADPALVVDGCRSVVVLGMKYLQSEPQEPEPGPGEGRVSKYARTRDYHRVIEKRLRTLARFVDTELAPGARTRGFVDYGPALERAWAVRAGLGFAGKHTLLIHPQEGSYFFLSVLLTTAHLAPTAPPPMTGCGDCRRCIDACPTQAITEPWRFDARRCLSYLTIEKQGPIPEEFRPHLRGRVFGCDICQDVCPYNRSRAEPAESSPLGDAIVPATIRLADWIRNPEAQLAAAGDASTPLRRAGADQLARNAAAAASGSADPGTAEALRGLAADERRPEWLRAMAREIAAEG